MNLTPVQRRELAYGENPQQTPAYLEYVPGSHELAPSQFVQVAGNPPSYNNLVDLGRLLITMTHLAAGLQVNSGEVPCLAVIVKHGNACSAAIGQNSDNVLERVMACNPLAAFGGLIMTNFGLYQNAGEILGSNPNVKFDGVFAPHISPEAIEALERKTGKCRFLANPALVGLCKDSLNTRELRRPVWTEDVVQPNYTYVLDLAASYMEAAQPWGLSDRERQLLAFAWGIGSTSTSNTITIVNDNMLIGNGVGQQARVYAAHLAVWLANQTGHGQKLKGAVAYSDSFFPHPDGLEVLAEAGVRTVLSSSGSVADKQVKKRANELGVTLVMVPDKIGRGFFHG